MNEWPDPLARLAAHVLAGADPFTVDGLPSLLTAVFDELAHCPQDPTHHGEGDVGVHTSMVAEHVASRAEAHSAADAELLALAAVFHDIAKPATTTMVDGRITAPGHARRGATITNDVCWKLGTVFELRHRLCGLVTHHLRPFHFVDADDMVRAAAKVCFDVPFRVLADLAVCDGCGRVCDDQGSLLAAVELFVEECSTTSDTLTGLSPAGRHRVCVRGERYEPYVPATTPVVSVLSGLPGSGKSTFAEQCAAAGAAVLSLDAIRAELGVSPADRQGPVVAAARTRFRELLRTGVDVVVDATNVTASNRRRYCDMALDYGYRTRIVTVDAPPDKLAARNSARRSPVPDQAIAKMAAIWELPSFVEAHELAVVDDAGFRFVDDALSSS